jgi:Restriction endonuclease
VRKRPCLICSRLTANPSRCDVHQREAERERGRQRGSSTARGYGAAWRRLRAELIGKWVAEYGYVCPGWQRPSHTARELTLDHVIPLSKGGASHPDNLRVLCKSCNSAKRDRV